MRRTIEYREPCGASGASRCEAVCVGSGSRMEVSTAAASTGLELPVWSSAVGAPLGSADSAGGPGF